MLVPVSLSKKLHLKKGNVDGELTETRLDDGDAEEQDSAIANKMCQRKFVMTKQKRRTINISWRLQNINQ